MDLFAPIPHIDAFMEEYLLSTQMPRNLRDAAMYAVVGGGKRLRPLLAWYSCTACGGRGEDSLPAAAAVEFIHAFSLVHDDLPALDNDDLRRGKPTLHKHAGEPMALLAGDLLLTLGFRVLADRARSEELGTLSSMLGRGTTDMISGQVLDTLGGFEVDQSARQNLESVHMNKTGALIYASCLMGATCASATASNLSAINTYAIRIGEMFQIIDDLIDVEQTAEHAGKRTGKDKDAGKLTYPSVCGVEESRKIANTLMSEALGAAQELGSPGEPLIQIAKLMATRTK